MALREIYSCQNPAKGPPAPPAPRLADRGPAPAPGKTGPRRQAGAQPSLGGTTPRTPRARGDPETPTGRVSGGVAGISRFRAGAREAERACERSFERPGEPSRAPELSRGPADAARRWA